MAPDSLPKNPPPAFSTNSPGGVKKNSAANSKEESGIDKHIKGNNGFFTQIWNDPDNQPHKSEGLETNISREKALPDTVDQGDSKQSEQPARLDNGSVVQRKTSKSMSKEGLSSQPSLNLSKGQYYEISILKVGMLLTFLDTAPVAKYADLNGKNVVKTSRNTGIYHKVRKFVIVKIRTHVICCLPIYTHNNRGLEDKDPKSYIAIRNESEKGLPGTGHSRESPVNGVLWAKVYSRFLVPGSSKWFGMTDTTNVWLEKDYGIEPAAQKMSVFGYLDLESRLLLEKLYQEQPQTSAQVTDNNHLDEPTPPQSPERGRQSNKSKSNRKKSFRSPSARSPRRSPSRKPLRSYRDRSPLHGGSSSYRPRSHQSESYRGDLYRNGSSHRERANDSETHGERSRYQETSRKPPKYYAREFHQGDDPQGSSSNHRSSRNG